MTSTRNAFGFRLLLFTGLFLLHGCGDTAPLQGYVEGEYVEVAAPLAGQLTRLHVRKGRTVQAHEPLFELENNFEQAAVDEARQNVLRADNSLADLGKGQRPTEIAAIQARLHEARSSLSFARTDYERKKRLFAEETISAQELDRARTEYETASQSVRRIEAELGTARLGGRSDELAAAQAELDAARAKLEQARWNLDQKSQSAPASGTIFDTYYEPGEWVAMGRPVISLLPSDNVKVIFFLPETMAGTIQPGHAALVSFDGSPNPVDVTITHIADQAEYTPPVIYSSQNRAKLVFRVEARPDPEDAALLRPGQPVDVTLQPQAPAGTGEDA
ncbi:HlyD family secretion protein [Paucidesulfovibrio gracilis DSM 16080]|uniref:HlyD family secretion protein n=1 Tax=Paucidesulfovibrio gracilis DSM 16080 TaxID=1121449 RepID=A0A1T4WB17_9BACT|nr:HlyD family efflux transporter periplasmic adaptor subunit [Paucidesulfovibrio gracilis]SKA74387.1 HlyD family secretion protein [Paucidesulfovibrio gracilis DSM 16080]